MDSKYDAYLGTLGITSGLRPELYLKIENAVRIIAAMSPEAAEDMFMSDVMQATQRVFHNLWLFSPHYVVQARNIHNVEEPDYFVMTYKGRVVSLEVSQMNYNWKQARDESVLVVNPNLGIYGGFQLRASGKNCDKLRDIYEKYIKPNYDIG